MSKPSTTNCPKTFVWGDTFRCWLCICDTVCLCAIVNLYRLYVIRLRELSGGYCGGVPPLPIPNREVKPTCADGTAMQCGRVGGRHLLQSTLFQQWSKVLFFVSSLYGSTEHTEYTDPRNTQSTRKIVEDDFHDFDTQAKAGLKPNGFHSPGQRPEDIMQHTPTTSCKDKTKIRSIYNRNLDLTSQLKAQKS